MADFEVQEFEIRARVRCECGGSGIMFMKVHEVEVAHYLCTCGRSTLVEPRLWLNHEAKRFRVKLKGRDDEAQEESQATEN